MISAAESYLSTLMKSWQLYNVVGYGNAVVKSFNNHTIDN